MASSTTRPGLLARAIRTYLGWCEQKSGSIVLLALVVAGLGIVVASQRISINPTLEALLPQDTRAARANAEARRRFAGSAPYYLVVQSSNPALNRRLIGEVLREVQEWDETLWAIHMRDPSYFLDRRLLYVDAERLKELADDVEVYLDWQTCHVMPGCVNLEDEPSPPDWESLRDHYRSLPELQALFSLFGEELLDEAGRQPRARDERNAGAPAAKDLAPLGELCAKGGRVCVVQAALRGDANDLDYASRMFHRGEALLESLRPPAGPRDLNLAVIGVYRNLSTSRDSVLLDLGKTFGLSLALVLGLLVLQFRGLRVLAMLIVPLLVVWVGHSVWSLFLGSSSI